MAIKPHDKPKAAKENATGSPSNKKITKDMMIGEVLEKDERLQGVLLGFGLHCFGCPMSQMETLEQAAKGHNVELELMLEQLNEMLNSPE